MIILDASVVVDLILRAPSALDIEEQIFARDASLHAPHLLDVEVTQVLRRFAAKGELSLERAREAFEDLADLPLRRWPHAVLLPRVWGLRQFPIIYSLLSSSYSLRSP